MRQNRITIVWKHYWWLILETQICTHSLLTVGKGPNLFFFFFNVRMDFCDFSSFILCHSQTWTHCSCLELQCWFRLVCSTRLVGTVPHFYLPTPPVQGLSITSFKKPPPAYSPLCILSLYIKFSNWLRLLIHLLIFLYWVLNALKIGMVMCPLWINKFYLYVRHMTNTQ